MFIFDYAIHAANVLYLLSYLVKDILWLRVLTVVAASTLMPYYYSRTPPLWPAIAWNLLFLAINIYHIRRLLLERRPVDMNEREQQLYKLLFRTLKPREFKRLVDAGEWCSAAPGDTLVDEGETPDRLLVIAAGTADVAANGAAVASLEPGCFIGEIAFLTGRAASAEVRAAEQLQYIAWSHAPLREFLADNPELRAAWQHLISSDLAEKLGRRAA